MKCKKCPQYDPNSQRSKEQAAAAEACVVAAQVGMSKPTGDATTPTPTGDLKSKGVLPGGYTTAPDVNTSNDTAAASSAFNLCSTGCCAGTCNSLLLWDCCNLYAAHLHGTGWFCSQNGCTTNTPSHPWSSNQV
eukprot:6953564-Ditylum_brightwellii.AAC.1